jgi:hypothetical protein
MKTIGRISGRIRRKVLQYLTRNLLKALTEEDVLSMTNRGWFVNRRALSPEEIANLKDEARAFETSTLWAYMSKDIEYVAFVRGRKAKTDEENLACHYMFYNLDIIAQYIRNCRKL